MHQRYTKSLGRWLVLLGAVAMTSCERGTEEPVDAQERRELLASLGEHVILPTYRDFVGAAERLREAAGAYATAAAEGEALAEREAAREAWREAMSVWQRAEQLQVGPAGSALKVMGGKDLRDELYSWPTVNTCRVDQEVARARYGEADFFSRQLVNVYGLDALEYLLFNESEENTCPSLAEPNSSGAWQALSAAQRRERRAAYAHAAAGHLVVGARALVSAWEPAEGNFLAQLASAGLKGSVYGTAQEGLDEVFAAMFYVDLRVKDLKLALPAGISADCPRDTCPEALESRWARHSKQNVAQNLRAFQRMFLGAAPGEAERLGFHAYLRARGAEELAERMAREIAAALLAVESIEGSLEEALAREPEQVRAAHAAVKALTDTIKSQFVTVLNLRVPQEGAGDND